MSDEKRLQTVPLSWLHMLTRGHSNNGEKKAAPIARVDETSSRL